MARLLPATAACLVFGLTLAAAPTPDLELTYIDLQPQANHKLKDPLHSSTEGNDLTVPKGKQTFEGAKFNIGEGIIQLGSKILQDKPEKVEGIKVDKKLTKLSILHATGYGGGPNQEGSELHVPDDTVIGKYIVHYEDKSKEEIEIAYGKDVRDWWYVEGEKEVSRGKVAWTGENEHGKKFNARIRLYLATWTNPKPDKKVVGIDYVSTMTTAAAPFCVAMTAEEKK